MQPETRARLDNFLHLLRRYQCRSTNPASLPPLVIPLQLLIISRSVSRQFNETARAEWQVPVFLFITYVCMYFTSLLAVRAVR